jgi:hypothetical protein
MERDKVAGLSHFSHGGDMASEIDAPLGEAPGETRVDHILRLCTGDDGMASAGDSAALDRIQ